jgi:hypothetical protein
MSRFTKMRDRDDQEIRATIEAAILECRQPSFEDHGLDFWKLCAGVDAYFEQRRRKEEAPAYGYVKDTPVDPSSPAWDEPTPNL